MSLQHILLCPGQGAQSVGMGVSWRTASPAAAALLAQADQLVELEGGARLGTICAEGPVETLNRTDVSQPALFACGYACHAGMTEQGGETPVAAALGLSLGEYTALALAGVFTFAEGLRLVATRGRLMQRAAEASKGGMVALIGGDEAKANEVCAAAAKGQVLVPANFNAPGQIVLSGHAEACDRAVEAAGAMGLRATKLSVAGAFHSPLMAPAAEGMARALETVEFRAARCPVWSNVTGKPHGADAATLKSLLVDQIVKPVRWDSCCLDMLSWRKAQGLDASASLHELAPGSVLRGLMRRIDRTAEVTTHDAVEEPQRAKA
jgi:[acyl-carrier-protein] S-malonyltransferase